MSDEAPITTTIKLGKDFDAPWIVLRAHNPGQAEQQLQLLEGDYVKNLSVAARAAQGVFAGSALTGPQPSNQPAASVWDNQPAQNQSPPPANDGWGNQNQAPAQNYGSGASAPTNEPANQAPTCKHGTKKWVTGNGQKGPWQAWMCPAKKGTPDQCKPDWQ